MSVGDGRFGPVAVSEGLFDAGNVQDKCRGFVSWRKYPYDTPGGYPKKMWAI